MRSVAARRSASTRDRQGRRRAALLIAGSLIWVTGCTAASGRTEPAGQATEGEKTAGEATADKATADKATAASRPVAKHTCSDVVWEPPASLGVVQTGRELVGFGPALLGLHTSWRGDGFTAETVAGGYEDDLTEAYDDLQVTDTLPLRPGIQAEVQQGRLLDDRVLAVVWRDPAEEVPCDVHALLVTGADPGQEAALLRGLH